MVRDVIEYVPPGVLADGELELVPPEERWVDAVLAACRHPLTAREYEVALLVAHGLTNRQIAAELFITPKTASAHVEHILAKLGAARRAEIAAWLGRITSR
jgi:DNA-binding CsgD family transcriptional regulator